MDEINGTISNFELDVFQIMPNHMHGIIVLNDFVGVGFTPTLNNANDKKAGTGSIPPQNEIDNPIIQASIEIQLQIEQND